MTILYDVLLDPDTGDLPLNPILSNGAAKVGQSAFIATKTHLGEVLFDTSRGLPYMVWGQQKPLGVDEVSDFVKRTIAGLNGVTRITEWTATFSAQDRKLTIVGTIMVEDGSEFEITVSPAGAGNRGTQSFFTIAGLPRVHFKGVR